MSHLWHAFLRTQSHSQRHYRPHCTLSCSKPRKILEKIFKTPVVGLDVGYFIVPQILVGAKRKQASGCISHDTL